MKKTILWREMAVLMLLGVPMMGQHGSTATVNPYTTAADEEAGGRLYRSQCAGCHGLDGSGSGAAPSLASGVFQHGDSDESLFHTISKGVPGTPMPAFAFSGVQIWQLVTHLRSLGIEAAPSATRAETEAGGQLFRGNCLSCHGIKGEGGFSGPDLTSIGLQRSRAYLRRALIDPDADLSSEYWSVVVSTVEGRTLHGRRLNEDTYSIQFRDEKGQLLSVLKTEIEKLEVVRKSPMPSFANTLSETQISNVVAFLTTLRVRQ